MVLARGKGRVYPAPAGETTMPLPLTLYVCGSGYFFLVRKQQHPSVRGQNFIRTAMLLGSLSLPPFMYPVKQGQRTVEGALGPEGL